MPKKIDFVVVYASGEDDKHPACELNVHGPTVKGWQSAKGCSYPQEIILKLKTRATLYRIQVLAHQYLIPEKVELWTHDTSDGGDDDDDAVDGHDDAEPPETTDVRQATFDYLGYITLSDNQSTGFRSRELKSVSVPTKHARYLKLRLGKNHDNFNNTHGQVSIIAINILGVELDADDAAAGDDAHNADTTSPNNNRKLTSASMHPQYVSPYDDLAFDMYVDTEIARLIREMETKKQIAVLDERFEYARKLKVAMERLREAGEKLGKYELEKRRAIEMEDYERARKKKTLGDTFRTQMYQQLDVGRLLEANGPVQTNDECTEITEFVYLGGTTGATTTTTTTTTTGGDQVGGPMSPPLLQVPGDGTSAVPRDGPFSPRPGYQTSTSPLHQANGRPRSPGAGSPTNNNSGCGSSNSSTGNGPHTRTGSFRRRNKSAGATSKSSYEAYEERTIPALRHSHTNEFLRECQLEAPVEPKTPSKLNDREKKQAALPILIFGTELVEKFYSKQYSDKEDGLNRLRDEMRLYDNNPVHTANKTARAAIFLLHRALRDKVFSVYSLAAEVIRLFFTEYVPGRVSQTEIARSVDRLLPELLTKSGDPTARIHNMAVHTILSMADCPNVRELHLIPVHLTRPVSSSTHPRLALSRMEMVEQLILNHGISTDKQSGLTCRTLSEFGSSGLHHPAEPVRKVAERVLILVYKVNPRLVRKQLPPDDEITRRNLLYRHLYHEFDKIDLQRKKELLERSRNASPPQTFAATVTKSKSSSNVQSCNGNGNGNGGGGARGENNVHFEEYRAVECYAKRADAKNSTLPRKAKTAALNGVAVSASPKFKRSDVFRETHAGSFEACREIGDPTSSSAETPRRKSGDLGRTSDDAGPADRKEPTRAGGGGAVVVYRERGRSAARENGDKRHSASSTTSGVSSPSDNSQRDSVADRQCIFCTVPGGKGERFYTDEQLNSHYWRACPMLTRCHDCGQVTEIASLTLHRLGECERRAEYRQCRRCREAVPLVDYLQHVTETRCVEAVSGHMKCPLCHENIPQAEFSWRNHLMFENPCPKNTRNRTCPGPRSKSAAK